MHENRRYPRTARLNELVREVLADEIERLDDDSRFGFLTVTGCEVSRDLRQAVVYYSVLGDDDVRVRAAEALRAATPHLKTTLGRSVRMKYTPDLIFREDPAVAIGARVEEIIRDIHSGDSEEGSETT